MTNDLTSKRCDDAIERCQPAPRLRVGVALTVALLAGLVLRQWAFEGTETIRFEPNQKNAFYWGDRIVHGANPNPGAADWRSFWRSYVSVYEADQAHPAPQMHALDYVPLRLLMAGAWVNYLNMAYGPVSEWRPEFARSFCAFSMVMELAGAAAMFALVARWLKRTGQGELRGYTLQFPTPRFWGRWEKAAAAAILLWLNPAAIVDSHVWPHGQMWIVPFYLSAILMMVEGRFFAAGVILGFGSMFKGQMMLVAPMLIMWPLFDRRWWGAVRVTMGIVCGVGAVVWPWLSHGSMAWARTGFASHEGVSDVLRKGQSLNIPALLEHRWHLTLHQHVMDQLVFGMHVQVELRSVLIGIYSVLLVCCSWGIARQARLGDRRLLVSVAAPWALMFFVLGQMDERYLVWSACFSAGAVAVGWWALGAHLILSWAGVATMIEFLLISRSPTYPNALHALLMTNPATWLLTGVAVAILFFGSIGSIKGSRKSKAAVAKPVPSPTYPRVRAA